MFSWRLFTRMTLHGGVMAMEDHYNSNGHTIHNLIWSYICLWCLLSCLTILFVLYMWCIFCHEKMRFWCHLPIDAIIEFWSLWCEFAKPKYPHLLLRIVWMSVIHKHSIDLLIKSIKTVLGFMAWSWEPGHWMSSNKKKSHIGIWLTIIVYLGH
jgi:hypothetical protein